MGDPARDLLVEELRESAGDEAAERGERELSKGGSQPAGGVRAPLLPALGGGLGLALGAFAGVVLGGWWWLPFAISLVIGVAVGVVTVTFTLLSRVEAPDPRSAARLEAEGIDDPEGELNDLIERAEGREPGRRVRRLFGDDAGELTKPAEDGAAAARDQQIAWTPSSGPSRPAGRD